MASHAQDSGKPSQITLHYPKFMLLITNFVWEIKEDKRMSEVILYVSSENEWIFS